MKKNILICFLLLILKVGIAQNMIIGGDSSTIENNSSFIHIDTSSGNDWQIGLSQKMFFGTAYSTPYAIMTDTLLPYTVNNSSTFIVEFTDSYLQLGDAYIGFWHKYETDSLKDGGYVEISVDSGASWQNVSTCWSAGMIIPNQINFYSNSDTILGNIPAFTGTKNNWEYSAIKLQWLIPVLMPHPSDDNTRGIYDCYKVMFRFVFKSDNIQTNKAGWIIDDIALRIYDIGGGIHENDLANFNVHVYPNPVKENGVVQVISKNNDSGFIITIYNTVGQLITSSKIDKNNQYIIKSNNLESGMYFYSVKSKEGIVKSGKLLIK